MGKDVRGISLSIACPVLAIILLTPVVANAQPSFTTYKDPNGRFSIDYPSNWKPKPAADRFENNPVLISSNPESILNLTTITVNIVDGVPPGTTIQSAFNSMINSLKEGFPDYDLTGGIDCIKYKLSGHNACSIIYTKPLVLTSDNSIKIAILKVATIVKGSLYIIEYYALPDNFDRDLPIVEKMLSSFKTGNT